MVGTAVNWTTLLKAASLTILLQLGASEHEKSIDFFFQEKPQYQVQLNFSIFKTILANLCSSLTKPYLSL